MKHRSKAVVAIVGVAAIVGAWAIGRASGPDAAAEEIVITPRAVERRTLVDDLVINGSVQREETQTMNSPVDGKVSSVEVSDGDTVAAGDALFSLDGRQAVAVDGDFAFFRQLDVGSVGPDVEQLERTLVAAGHPVTSVDELFTEETRDALADWQIQHGYGGATPEVDETITIALSANSAGYQIAAQNTSSFTVTQSVPDAPEPLGFRLRPARPTRSSASTTAVAAAAVKPTIELTADVKETAEGSSFTVTVTSDPAPQTDLTVDLTIGGDATGGDDPADGDDYSEVEDSIVIPAGQTTVAVPVSVFVDQVIENAEDIQLSLSDQFGNDPNYVVGPRNEARVVVRANGDDLVPVLTIKASTSSMDEGASVTFTVESTVESNEDLDFSVDLGGSADRSDYVVPEADSYTIAAGDKSVQIDVQVRGDDIVEQDETLDLVLRVPDGSDPAKPPYVVGDPGAVSVLIQSDDLPKMTLSGSGVIAEGGSASFTISADAAVTENTSINYQVGGTAQGGEDYEVLSGTALMRAGTRSVTVGIRTIDDDVVFQPSDMLVAAWPARVGTVEVDEGEFVLQGAALLSLTEPTFTVTLSVPPSDRAKLDVGQTVELRLEAGDQTLPGVISQLDDSATIDEQGVETYEGTVTVEGELDAVDGASVSIEVTLAERVDVLAVPVAAVVRTAGGDEVRTVNDQGTITRLPVTIGLIDEEWVEIVEGLAGDELIVIDVDAAAEPAPETG